MYDTDWSLLRETIPLPLPVLMMISRAVRKQAHGQGMGRHSQQEVMAIGQADLKALSVFLGEKCCSSYSPDSAPPPMQSLYSSSSLFCFPLPLLILISLVFDVFLCPSINFLISPPPAANYS